MEEQEFSDLLVRMQVGANSVQGILADFTKIINGFYPLTQQFISGNFS